jgi:hypothetical protein
MNSTVINFISLHSTRQLGGASVFNSCLGGFELGWAAHQWMRDQDVGALIVELLFGSAFLALGIFYAMMLIRRASHLSCVANQK